MKEIFNKNFGKDKNLKISEDLHFKLTNLKKQFKFSTFDNLILYLLNEKKSDIEEYIEVRAKEEILNKIENSIYDRVESIQKRMSKFSTLYFEKIIDTYNLHEQSTIEILKRLNGNGLEQAESNISVSSNDSKELERLKSENKKLLQDSLDNDNVVQDLEDKLRLIKSKYELKSGAFSSGYESKLTKSEYEEIFN